MELLASILYPFPLPYNFATLPTKESFPLAMTSFGQWDMGGSYPVPVLHLGLKRYHCSHLSEKSFPQASATPLHEA